MKAKLPGFLNLLEQLHQSPLRSLAATLESWLEPIVNPHNSVIDRSIERLEILIDDCKTVEELAKVADAHSLKINATPSLSKLTANKLEELSK